jgi:hypothetical protein
MLFCSVYVKLRWEIKYLLIDKVVIILYWADIIYDLMQVVKEVFENYAEKYCAFKLAWVAKQYIYRESFVFIIR